MDFNRVFGFFVGLFFLTGSVAAEAPTVTQELIFPYVISGGGWECDITLVSQGAEATKGKVSFFDNAGAPLSQVVNGEQPRSVVAFDLIRQTAANLKVTGPGGLAVGYALVHQDSDSEHGAISGLITFRNVVNGQTVQQVGVRAAPLAYSSQIPFDNTAGNQTAVAVMSLNREPVTLFRYDRFGQQIERFQLNFKYWQSNLLSAFVGELFPGSRFQRGYVRVDAPKGAYILVLNQNNLILSTGDSFASVIERQLHIQLDSAVDWTVRLVQQGDILYGIAQQQPDDGPTEFITGSFSGGTLHLSLSHRADGVGQDRNCVLVGNAESLDSVSGAAVLVSAGGMLDSGTFQLTKPDGAQY